MKRKLITCDKRLDFVCERKQILNYDDIPKPYFLSSEGGKKLYFLSEENSKLATKYPYHMIRNVKSNKLNSAAGLK